MLIEIDIPLFEKQCEFMSYHDQREVLFEGGIGSGKTTTGALWLAEQALTYDKSKWLMTSRDNGQLVDATSAEFDYVLQDMLGLEEDVHYTKNQKPMKYTFHNTGAIVNGRSAHNYDSSFRGPNYWGAWADEADFYKAEAIEKLRGRIRRGREQIRYTSSPNGFNHIYNDFYVKKMGPVVHATTYDNPTLSTAYIESLRQSYSPRLFEQEVLAKRLRINVGAVYNEFNREKHLQDLTEFIDKVIHDRMEIYFFTDYNIANYCGVYLVFYKGKVYCIGEEHLQFKGSSYMAMQVRARFPDNPIIVCGDATGNNKKDVAIEKTNYAHFESAGLMTKNFKNPPVNSRIISANSRMHHGKCIIHSGSMKYNGCPILTKDLELVAWKEDGSDIDKSNIELSHASDAYTYGLWHFLPITIKKKSTSYQG